MKMPSIQKPSRLQLILIVAVVVLLVVNVFLAKGYFSAVSTKADLEEKVGRKETQIANLEGLYNIEALERELAEAQRKLAEEAPFLEDLDPLDLLDHIINAVQEAGLGSYSYTPGGVGTVGIGGGTYKANSYAIELNSDEQLRRLIKFLRLIEELPYNTLKINDITLSSAGDDTWNLKFNIVIITQ
jgi:hypothetical protein